MLRDVLRNRRSRPAHMHTAETFPNWLENLKAWPEKFSIVRHMIRLSGVRAANSLARVSARARWSFFFCFAFLALVLLQLVKSIAIVHIVSLPGRAENPRIKNIFKGFRTNSFPPVIAFGRFVSGSGKGLEWKAAEYLRVAPRQWKIFLKKSTKKTAEVSRIFFFLFHFALTSRFFYSRWDHSWPPFAKKNKKQKKI